MRIRIEIEYGAEEEIILRAPRITEEIRELQEKIADAAHSVGEIALQSGDTELFLPYSEILFFETSGGKILAHTAGDCFVCPLRLYELETLLPLAFVRASKACLLNTSRVYSITRSLTGVSEVCFTGSTKRTSVSRMYYHTVRDRIEQTRLSGK